MSIDYLSQNQAHWDAQAQAENAWSTPVSDTDIAHAKQGHWQVHLTPNPVKPDWLGDVQGKRILCLASAGGQQAPILAAAGARVVVFDLSVGQLGKDAALAQQHHLDLTTIQGDMTDLSALENASFDMVFHPISNLYVPDVRPVWQECYRVLKSHGRLMASFYNPVVFVDNRDAKLRAEGLLKPTYQIPYADSRDLPQAALQQKISQGEALVFGHSLSDLLAGQMAAGFWLKDFVEDFAPQQRFLMDAYIPTFLATLAIKP